MVMLETAISYEEAAILVDLYRDSASHETFVESFGIQKAIQIAGSQSALARKIGVPPQYVQYWASKNRVPAERVIAIERATDGKVSRAELRPDLFGIEVESNSKT